MAKNNRCTFDFIHKLSFYLVLLPLIVPLPTLAKTDKPGFHPTVNINIQQEDNVRRTPKEKQQGDSILVLAPKLPLLWNVGKQKLKLTYAGKYLRYSTQEMLSHKKHKFVSQLQLRHKLGLTTKFVLKRIIDSDIPDDNNLLADLNSKPIRWQENSGSASLSFGNPSNRGRIVAKVERKQRIYINNSQFLNVNRTRFAAVFYYRITPKSRIPFELNVTDYNYRNISLQENNPSSREVKYLTGINWYASKKSTGIFQFGILKKQYENNVFDDTSIFTLRLESVWRPNSYTKMIFGGARNTQESLQSFSKANIQNHFYTKINHEVTALTTLFFDTRYTNLESDGADQRKELRYSAKIGALYNLRHWLNIKISYSFKERDSDLSIARFKTNIITLAFQVQPGF